MIYVNFICRKHHIHLKYDVHGHWGYDIIPIHKLLYELIMVLCNIITLQPISSHIKNLIIRIRIDRKLYLLKMQGHFKGITWMIFDLHNDDWKYYIFFRYMWWWAIYLWENDWTLLKNSTTRAIDHGSSIPWNYYKVYKFMCWWWRRLSCIYDWL